MSRRAEALSAYRAGRIAELDETRPRSQRRAELAERRRAARKRPDTTHDLLSAAE